MCYRHINRHGYTAVTAVTVILVQDAKSAKENGEVLQFFVHTEFCATVARFILIVEIVYLSLALVYVTMTAVTEVEKHPSRKTC